MISFYCLLQQKTGRLCPYGTKVHVPLASFKKIVMFFRIIYYLIDIDENVLSILNFSVLVIML